MDDPVDRALALIEARLDQPLALADLAAAGGLSPFHFARVFAARVGESPMAHVRRLRLAAAARRLETEPGARLVDLALEGGFESQSAFTRAFTRLFGISPGRYRRAPCPLPHWSRSMSPTAILRLEDVGLRRRAAFAVAGVRCSMTETDKSAIPRAWETLWKVAPPGPAETFGVIWAGEEGGPMNYLAGAALAVGGAPAAGLETVAIPAALYWVFRQTLDDGPVPAQVHRAVEEIWGRRVPASGMRFARTPDFELYPADFTPGRDGAIIEYWLPVEA